MEGNGKSRNFPRVPEDRITCPRCNPRDKFVFLGQCWGSCLGTNCVDLKLNLDARVHYLCIPIVRERVNSTEEVE